MLLCIRKYVNDAKYAKCTRGDLTCDSFTKDAFAPIVDRESAML